MLLSIGCTRLEGARSSMHASRCAEACFLACYSNCASGLHSLGWRVIGGDVHTPEDEMCPSTGCMLFDVCFLTPRGMLFSARL